MLVRTLASFVAIVGVGWVCGDMLLDWVRGRKREAGGRNRDLPERALAAVVGLCAFCLVLMFANIVLGGAVFGTSAIVPLVSGGILIYGAASRRWPSGVPWMKVLAAALLLSALFIWPVLRGGSGARTGDTPWHLGWTEQLLGGQPVPTGPAPGYSQNAYPWGWHALMATTTRVVPGSEPLVAHDALHMVIVFAIPLGAACLARRMRPTAGWAGAAGASLIGGWGWLSAAEPDFVASPTLARYGADLVVASPNSIYELFPPALPREMGVVLLAATGVLLLRAAARPDARALLAGGAVLGLTGIVSVPMLIAGTLWTLAVAATVAKGMRARFVLMTAAAALPVFALWAGPVIDDYMRFGGFVDITPELGAEWSLPTALSSWGMLLPLAAAGLALIVRRGHLPGLVAFAGATALYLALTKIRTALGWDLVGNATLLHQGRVWPAAHMLAAAFAGAGAVAIYEFVRKRSRALALVATSLALGVGLVSPLFASLTMTEFLASNEHGFTYDRPDLAEGSFARRAAAGLDPDDVVRVKGGEADRLAFLLWQLSGARLAGYDDPRLPANDLRIRFSDLAARWEQAQAGGKIEADVVVSSFIDGGRPNSVAGEYGDQQWSLVRRDRPAS
ncbi:MAG: hypothetical protein H0V97_05620 [Actinobacteria bacterium]|nr:hypothetical protein [Actinomycetota bacterium]